MAAKKPVHLLQRSVHPYTTIAVLIGGVGVILALLAVSRFSSSSSIQTQDTVSRVNKAIPISIPPAQWLNNSYQYYDSNLDAILYIPKGWKIVNDPSAAGLPMPPQPIGACYPDLKDFFKDFSQCPTTLGYALKITPNATIQNSNYLVLMGVSNGFGGSCNDASDMALYDAHVTINNHPYVVTTGAWASFNNTRIHLDCYYWPRISETGSKSVWAMFTVRHRATDDATFTTEMQILENIKFQ